MKINVKLTDDRQRRPKTPSDDKSSYGLSKVTSNWSDFFLSQNVRESRVTVSDLQRSLFIVYFVVGQRVTFVAYLGHRFTHGEFPYYVIKSWFILCILLNAYYQCVKYHIIIEIHTKKKIIRINNQYFPIEGLSECCIFNR